MSALLLGLVWAQTPIELVFPPVRTDLGDGAVIDWTAGELVVTASARRAGSEGARAVEELARRAVDGRMLPATRAVPLEPGRLLGDLESVPELWSGLGPRLGRWVETENRYFTSGRVEVVGTLSLVEALKPWTMASARPTERVEGEHTGAVLDARGTEATPCYAPVVQGPDGPVATGRLSLDAATRHTPAVWVSDAADPAVARAGSRPLAGAVLRAEGCRVEVDGALARGLAAMGPALASGALVIVVGR